MDDPVPLSDCHIRLFFNWGYENWVKFLNTSLDNQKHCFPLQHYHTTIWPSFSIGMIWNNKTFLFMTNYLFALHLWGCGFGLQRTRYMKGSLLIRQVGQVTWTMGAILQGHRFDAVFYQWKNVSHCWDLLVKQLCFPHNCILITGGFNCNI